MLCLLVFGAACSSRASHQPLSIASTTTSTIATPENPNPYGAAFCESWDEYQHAVAVANSKTDVNSAVSAWQSVDVGASDLSGPGIPGPVEDASLAIAGDTETIVSWLATKATDQQFQQHDYPPEVSAAFADVVRSDQEIAVYARAACPAFGV